MDDPIRKRTVAEPPGPRADRFTRDGRTYRWYESTQEWKLIPTNPWPRPK